MNNGKVLVTGGVKVNIRPLIPPPANFAGATAISDCEYYDPGSNSWISLPSMNTARTGHTVTQMSQGMVIIAGGAKGAIDASLSVGSIQEFNPTSNTFVRSYTMISPRSTHGACLTPGGSIILLGGSSSSTATSNLRSMEIIHR